MKALGPKLPLSMSDIGGGLKMIRSQIEAIRQHLKMLLLTSPGERILYYEYGVGIKDYLFEKDPGDLESRIYEQTSLYMPYIEIQNVNIEIYENSLNMKLEYYIPALNGVDIFEYNIEGTI